MNKKLHKKRTLLFVILCYFVLFSHPYITLGALSKSTKQSQQLPSQSTDNMIETIKKLSSNTREYGTTQEKKACNYINRKLKSYGYSPYMQKMKRRDKTGSKILKSQNLIAVKKSNAKVNHGIIVICAHYDCDKNSYGANDDASGCAVVLETARLLKNVPSTYELRFVFFGMGKYFNAGANEYVGSLSEKDIQNITAVIEIDSVANKNNRKPELFTVCGKKNNATTFIKSTKANQKLSINKVKTYHEISDYGIFDYNMMPALCICQPYSDKIDINNDKDLISGIDKSKLNYVVSIILNAFK